MFCKIVKENRKPLKAIKATANHRHVEMKKILGGGLQIMKHCRPPWFAEEENFSFQIV